MREFDGMFKGNKQESHLFCSTCHQRMYFRVWESSCGGYEDEKHECLNPQCDNRQVVWIDGPDS